jgi:hypothetical protein
MWGGVQVGDWVRSRARLPVTLADHLLQSGIKPGARGVVTATSGSRALVDFDAGLGTVSASVSQRHLRVVRRGGGIGSFKTNAHRRLIARVALIIFLALPVLQFLAAYAWINRGFDGITVAFAEGVVQSVLDWLNMLLTQPARTAIYIGCLWVVARLARS